MLTGIASSPNPTLCKETSTTFRTIAGNRLKLKNNRDTYLSDQNWGVKLDKYDRKLCLPLDDNADDLKQNLARNKRTLQHQSGKKKNRTALGTRKRKKKESQYVRHCNYVNEYYENILYSDGVRMRYGISEGRPRRRLYRQSPP